MMFMSGRLPRAFLTSVGPSMFGITTSEISRSMVPSWVLTMSSPASPLAASSTV